VAFDCPLDVLIEEYGRTSGRTRADGERLPSTQVILRATNLSEPQLLHAFDTVLAWHGLKIATQDEKTFKVVRLPESRETIPPPPVREVPARYRPLIFYTNDNATIAPLTYTDKQRGVTYRVESDGRHVSASAADGKLLWRRNPFVEAQMEPYRYTKPLIRQIGAARDIDFRGDPDAIWIRFNSSQSGTIDPRTGEFHYVFRE
jgi:hypothetical protein